MEYNKQTNGNIKIENENESFTFINMGNYVGYQSRNWYDEAPDCWKLMQYEEKNTNNQIKIEALVDTDGDYMKITVSQNNLKRILQLNGKFVDEDIIIETNPNELMIPKKSYIAFEDNYKEKQHPSLETYLSEKQQFTSKTGETYNGIISSNDYINHFLKCNIELSKTFNEQTTNKTR